MSVSRFLLLFGWAAPHVLQIPIAAIMVRRKMVREFPIFFIYTCVQILLFAVLFTIDQVDRFTGDQYVVAWLVEQGISIALRFAVIHEVFQHVFQSYSALRTMGERVFRWATVVLMIVAVVLVALSSGTNLDRVSLVYVVINRAVFLMQVGLLLLLLLLVKHLRLAWSTYVFPIVVGFGVYASTMLALNALQAHIGAFSQVMLAGHVEHVGYFCTVVVWLTGLLMPARVANQVEAPIAPDLENWNAALQRLLEQ